jgi:hypothetical protein
MSEKIPAAKVRKAVANYVAGAKLGEVAKLLGIAPEKAERVLWRAEPIYADGAKVSPLPFDLSTREGRAVAASVVFALREGRPLPDGYVGGRIASDAIALRYERIAYRTGIALGTVRDLYAIARDGGAESDEKAGKPRPEAVAYRSDSYVGRGRRGETTRDLRAIREEEEASAGDEEATA